MKITGIEIGEYRQFKNIKFDFTYPADHERAYQPLDKVCFIGQSGTGKTTLLQVIWGFILGIVSRRVDTASKDTIGDIKIQMYLNELHSLIVNRWPIHENVGPAFNLFINEDDPDEYILWYRNLSLKETLFNKIGLYIKESIAREADAFLLDQSEQPQTFSDFVKTTAQVENEKAAHDQRINTAGFRKAISLGDMDSLSTWQYLLKDINAYDEAGQAILHRVSAMRGASAAKAIQELTDWLEKTPNPRVDLGKYCLNPILNKFFLEVDPGGAVNVPIALQTTQGVKIPNDTLSTGIRQILATAIPIYKFDTNGTVILFDEPERSLFPDVQRELVDYYTSLAPTAQFFFATHSPIVAASFEPCERFILYFNENGEVDFHRGVAPEGDDPNDVLIADFGMDELMGAKGLAAYQRYRNLFVQIKNEKDPVRKQELIVEQAKLGDQYKF